MTLSTSKAALAGLALLATSAAFNANAEAIHPLLDTSTGATAYSGSLEKAIEESGVYHGAEIAGGATVDLEAALKQPTNDARAKYFPPKPRTGETFVSYVVPPASVYSTAAIPVCVGQAGQGGAVFWTGKILTNGQVVADAALPAADTTTGNPCKAFLGLAQSDLQGAALAASGYPPVKASVIRPASLN